MTNLIPSSGAGSSEGGPGVYVLLDDNTGLGGPSALYTEPVEIVRADEPADVPAALARLEGAAARGLHAAGYFGYELGYALEPRLAGLMPAKRTVPLLWFGLFPAPRLMAGADVDAWLAERATGPKPRLEEVSHSWSEADYVKRFERAVANIHSGDIYQINLTFRARFRLEGSAVALYRELRQKQRVAYGGIIETGDLTILSASPELFIERYGQSISTRPMKGTSPRGADTARDDEMKRVLATDAKQRAENLMIVDLMRNDLGRIADVGSVEVTDLFTVETFKTLHQMTSGVRARLIDGLSLDHLLAAIFPPGSVTGAPKIRAMELIAELEDSPRGVYCGAIGRISPDGHSLFNVAIRTPVFTHDGRGEMGIGSGVVADSEGTREYAECLLKMRFLTDHLPRFELIETMLFDPALGPNGAFWLLDGHLARLERSSRHFGFTFDRRAVTSALDRAVEHRRAARLRVRLLLGVHGAVTVTVTELPAPPANPVMRYVISPTRLDSKEPFLAHKTTERQLYDREWHEFHDTRGADEVVYLNERGELAEGSRTSIFVERNGRLLTPPLDAGALPGVLRAELLSSGRAVEARLTLDDLASGRVFLGNSVRGLVPAEPLAENALTANSSAA
jgi:para-aminobenzoate synthetase/4-amino-4-deoxychorismate lyase